MDYGVIATSVITSTAVSALVSALMKYHFDKRLLQLQVVSEFAADWARQRSEALKEVGDLVYRARNAARDSRSAKESSDTLQRLVEAQESLQEALFTYRVLLEREELFAVSHQYRAYLKNLEHAVRGIQQQSDQETRSKLSSVAEDAYSAIDQQYYRIVSMFKKAIRPPEPDSLKRT